jgi:hypothetical protein
VVYVGLGKVVAPRVASNVQRGEKDVGPDNFEKRLDEIKRCCRYEALLILVFLSLTRNHYFYNEGHEYEFIGFSTCSQQESR